MSPIIINIKGIHGENERAETPSSGDQALSLGLRHAPRTSQDERMTNDHTVWIKSFGSINFRVLHPGFIGSPFFGIMI